MIKGDKPKVWPQWIAAAIVYILSMLTGLVAGWTSPYLAKLTTGSETLTITNDEGSWIASLFHLSRPIGSIIGAVTVHKFGTKHTVFIAGFPFGIAWIFFLIRESVPWIYASRVSSGVAMGLYLGAFPLYIGEIGNPKIRGALVGLVSYGSAIGYLMGNLLGAYISMRNFSIINLVLSIFFLVSFLYFPSTAHYFVKKNNMDEAEKSLKWYNRQRDVAIELESLKMYIGKPQKLTLKESFKQWTTPLNRKTLFMVICVYLFMQLSGLYTIAMYLEILLTKLKIDVIAPSLVVVAIGIVAIIGGCVAIYTNDHCGRRTMLAASTLGVSINFALIGVNYLLAGHGYDLDNYQWYIIAEFMAYIFFLNIGLTHIPNCLLSEIFSPELKEIGTCIVNIVCACSAFLASKSYQPLLDATSEEFIFFFYAFLVFLMFLYTIIVIPETKGKSLQEIQDMLMKRDKTVEPVQIYRTTND
ncbi:facilitated trehalose transporter Tret1 [Fopius arisanus]|uniref:Facilitated trehalose transporter Tret1 n=1 Tax=Fopius arisanus TaxID=64838 RepID=A0A0C9QPC8_9HYME|nr:PREDICTED: facilitated trehalose transporter Tret1-like [Fopius arisanus]